MAAAVTIANAYNSHGYLEMLKHGTTELVKVTALTAYGQAQNETYGNGVVTARKYDKLGRLTDDDAGDTHTISATSANDQVATVTVSGSTLTVTGVAVGSATITVTATDDSGADNDTSEPETFSARVRPPNSQPVVSLIADRTLAVGGTAAVPVEVTDDDAGDTHTISATSANDQVATVGVSGSTLTITGVAVGSATITVTATDNSGADNDTSEPVTFSASVAPAPNNQPVVSPIGDETLAVGGTAAVPVEVTDDDAGDTHTISATSANDQVATVTVSGSTLTVTGVAVGSATITVTATDDSGADNDTSEPETFSARVRPPNSQPVVSLIADRTLAVGGTAAVPVEVTDDDAGDTHTISATSANDQVATVGVSGSTLTITGVAVGSATITVTATDNSGADNDTSEPVTFSASVAPAPNNQPVVSPIGDETLAVGGTAAVPVEVTDDDAGDTHTISATSANDQVATVTVSGSTLTVTGVAVGSATITVTATDDSGADNDTSEPVTFSARVRPPNSQPVVSPIADRTLAVGGTAAVPVEVTDDDAGDTHTISATSANDQVATVGVSGSTLTITGVAVGSATITVTATDNSGADNDTSEPVTFSASVAPAPNNQPVVSPIGDETLAVGGTAAVPVEVTDDDAGDTHTISATSANNQVATVEVSGSTLTITGVAVGSATITVTATDDSGADNDTSEPETFSASVTPSPPGRVSTPEVSPVPGSETSLRVSWTAPSDNGSAITDYDVQYRQEEAGDWSGDQHIGNDNSVTITGLTAGTTYEVRVRAENAVGEGDWSPPGKGTPGDLELGTPSIEGPSSSTTGNYTLSWSSVTNADSYELEEKVGSGAWTGQDSSGTSKSYKGKGLGSYHYRVKACAGGDCGDDWSSTHTVTVELATPILTAPFSTTWNYAVSWTESANATSYTLEERYLVDYNLNLWTPWYEVQSGASTSKSFEEKAPGTYDYRVKACAGSDTCSGWSNSEQVVVTGAPPGRVSTPAVSPVPGSETSLRVSWTAPSDNGSAITDYDVQYREEDAGDWSGDQHIGNDNSVTITGLTADTTYEVRVRAENAIGEGDWSPPGKGTPGDPQLGTPSIEGPSSSTTGNYTLSWSSVTNADSYELEEKVGSGAWTGQDSSGTSKSYKGKGLGSYHYRVKACAGGDCGDDWSSTHTVTVELATPILTAPFSTTWNYAVSWTESANATSYTLEERYLVDYNLNLWTPWYEVQSGASTSKSFEEKAPGTYDYRVKACAGSDTCSGWSNSEQVVVTGPPPPGRVSTPAVSPVPGGITMLAVRWTAPTDNGSAITGYDVQYLKQGDATWTDHPFSGAGTTTTTIRGLTARTRYEVRVRAENDAGPGLWSDPPGTGATPSEPDRVPTPEVSPVPSDNTMLAVRWTAPTDNGSAITDYDVQYLKQGDATWTDHPFIGAGTSTTLTTTIRELSPGTTYEVRVRAQNAVGKGLWSNPPGTGRTGSTRLPPDRVPTPEVSPVPGSTTRLAASWTPPSDNGSAITDYDVQYLKQGDADWTFHTFHSAGTSTTLLGLAAGTTYEVRVRAQNAGGEGDWSDPPGVGATPPTVDCTSLTISWPAPSNSGSPITGYDVAYREAGTVAWSDVQHTGTNPSVVIPGLSPGTTYEVRVRAKSDGSEGPWGNVAVVTLLCVPGRPSSPTVSPVPGSSTELAASWTPPSDNGSAITDYDVQYRQEEAGDWSGDQHIGNDNSVTITGLTAGTTYEVRVRAENAVGEGDWSPPGKGTPGDPQLGTPSIEGPSSSTTGNYTLSWSSVTNADSYELEEKVGSGAWTGQDSSGTSKSYKGKGLGSYHYRVKACAGGDCGDDWSSTHTVTVEELGTPSIEGPSSSTTGNYTLSWSSVTNADSYELEEKVGSGAWTGQDSSGTSKSYKGKGLGSYHYRVKACAGGDCGDDWSSTHTVTVELATPILTAPSSSTGDYTVSWTESANATSYTLEERYLVEYNLNLWTPWYEVQSEASTWKRFEDKAPGTYQYRVKACAGDCSDDWSNSEQVVVGNFLPAEGIAAADGPGSLPYRTGVTKGGDAYVNVPIAPAPGVNGLEPRLSIDYGGGRERQLAGEKLPGDAIGYGWRVSGVSTIRRCVKGTDDSDGIDFDDTDALCLDGEPLTLISDDDHLEGGAEYRTARERFAEVVLKDDPYQDWFEVRLPDGTVREYGRTADSQLWVPAQEEDLGQPARAAAPFIWSINKQTDPFDNFMTYEYYKEPGTSTHYPIKVEYGDGGDATIEFVYWPRTDPPESVFISPEWQWRRLVYIHVRFEGALVRDYRLGYETESGRMRLNELQMCGYGSFMVEHCLEPLAIDWMEPDDAPRVEKLTDPMGAETTFTREMLTEDDAHDFVLGASGTPFGATSLPPDTRALPAEDGNVKPVVTKVSRSDGIGGTRDTRYAYLGRGVESERNWGFLGFHAIRRTDSASGIVTYTQYRLDYPHFGRPAAVHRYRGNYDLGKTLSKRSTRYAEESIAHEGSTATTTLPYAKQTTEWLYEGSTELGATQTTETLEAGDDGLLEWVERQTQTAHGADGENDAGTDWGDGESYALSDVQRTAKERMDFENDATGWVLGFVNRIEVGHYAGSASGAAARTEVVERTSIPDTLAADIVTRFPDDPDLEHETDYGYDDWGNRTDASETAEGSDRWWKARDFRAGRYPTSWRNPLDHTEYADYPGRYAGLGVPKSTTDANRRETRYVYDGLGREIRRTRVWDGGVATETSYSWCHSCAAVSAPPSSGCDSAHSVTPAMKVVTRAPDMPTTTAYLDVYGRAIRTAVEGFDGDDDRLADAFYDARGRTVCESEPYHDDGVETAKYTRYEYDTRDRLKKATRPDGGETSVEYEGSSNEVTATIAETVKESDGAEATTRETERVYNVLGELTSTTEGADEAASKRVETSYAYDGAGQIKTVTIRDQTTTFTYDDAGNRTSVENPNLGARVSTADSGMVSVKFEYNGFGELTERADARGATYYGYDDLGRLTCAADRGGTATWEYDPANGTGLLKRRSYDRDTVLANASSCAFGSDFAETYAYYNYARLETVTTSIVDDEDETTPLTRSHAYDSYGRLSSTTYPAAVTVDYDYNSRGYLEKLKHGATALVEVRAQTAHGQSKVATYGNGVETERAYDALGRLTDIDTTMGTTTIQDNAYAWRSDGSLERRTARAAGGRGKREESFDYDYLNRLTGAKTYLSDSATASRTLAFKYDLRGNLETKTSDVSADDSVTNAYPTTSNRLSSATIGGVAHTFTHDTSGHITGYDACSDNTATCAAEDDTFIAWNARGLATEVTLVSSADADSPTARDSFYYGPDGSRYFRKSVWQEEEETEVEGETTTTTVTKTTRTYYAGAYEKTVTVDGATVERTRIGDSVIHVKTTPAATDTAATATSAFEYLHRDHLGSVEAVTDASGAELVVLGHDPYGERRDEDWTAQLTPTEVEELRAEHGERVSRGYTGHEHLDRTGLVHMNGRVYDPRLGRFLSPDPIVGDPTSSQSWNLYSYVGNNPLSYVDPTGLSTWPLECDWVCEEDIDAWWDWWNFLNSWYYYDSSWDPSNSWDPSSSQDYEAIRSKAEKTLKAVDRSVAEEPEDGGTFDAIGVAISGWLRGILERKHAELKADCERIHGPGGCEGASVKELQPVFSEATGQVGAAGVGKVVAGVASRTTVRVASSVPKATPGSKAKPTPNFEPPTNLPQLPPSNIPQGTRIFRGKPTEQYPDGYWKIEKFDGQGWQRLDPRTMKPGPHRDTHILFPKGYKGPFDN